MFYRASTAVLSPLLVEEFGFSTAELSDLSAVFFYTFAAAQLPIGIALDRVGARRTAVFLTIVALTGAVIFTTAQSGGQLILGRALLGIGMGGNLMVLLALFAAWFPADRFASLSGAVVAIGTAGSLAAATPLAVLSLRLGWRGSFLTFVILNAVVAAAFLLVIRDSPPDKAGKGSGVVFRSGGLGSLFKMYSFWAISLACFVRYGFFAALQSLWIAPFMMFGLGMGEMEVSYALLCLGLGYMVGLPASGLLSDRLLRSRKKVVLTGTLAFAFLTLYPLSWTASVSQWKVLATFFAVGAVSAPGQILYAHMKELIPSDMLGRAMTSVNLFTMLGAGLMTQMLGLIIGGSPTDIPGPAGFAGLWYGGAVALAVASVLYSLVPDTRPFGPRKKPE